MNAIVFSTQVLDARRAADLVREVELLRVQRERSLPNAPERRPLVTWLRAVTHVGPRPVPSVRNLRAGV